MKFSTTPLCLLLLALALLGCYQGKEKQEYLTIGALLPLTGADSEEGVRALNGLQLAKEEINENGGISGKKLDIIALNDRGNEKYVLQQYNELKNKGVKAIIGSSAKNVTTVLSRAALADGIPLFSPSAENITYNDDNGKLTDFEKKYFNVFSQMPLPVSAAAYKCVYIMANTFNSAER
jgi:ABC-type sugar transport system substrate-binding protein